MNRQMCFVSGRRSGLTMLETCVALAILGVALVLVAQLGYLNLREGIRADAQSAALELAANILEAAQAQPWAALNSEWAAAQQVPDLLRPQLADGELNVKVEPEPDLPQTKRVTVEVRWQMPEGVTCAPVRLLGLFSRRNAGSAGESP
jgi:type II secretory pathway pseudopilin PulG